MPLQRQMTQVGQPLFQGQAGKGLPVQPALATGPRVVLLALQTLPPGQTFPVHVAQGVPGAVIAKALEVFVAGPGQGAAPTAVVGGPGGLLARIPGRGIDHRIQVQVEPGPAAQQTQGVAAFHPQTPGMKPAALAHRQGEMQQPTGFGTEIDLLDVTAGPAEAQGVAAAPRPLPQAQIKSAALSRIHRARAHRFQAHAGQVGVGVQYRHYEEGGQQEGHRVGQVVLVVDADQQDQQQQHGIEQADPGGENEQATLVEQYAPAAGVARGQPAPEACSPESAPGSR